MISVDDLIQLPQINIDAVRNKKFDVGIPREIIIKYILKIQENENKVKTYRQLYDFIFMTLFMDNDYLPHRNSFKILKDMLTHYEGKNGVFLTEFTRVNEDNLHKLLQKVTRIQYLEHKGEKVRGMIERRKIIIGSRTKADYVEKFINAVRCCWELNLTGDAEWRWAYRVDRGSLISMICGNKYKRYWKIRELEPWDEKTHRLDPLTHLMLVLPYASLKRQPYLLPESYRKFRQQPDIRWLYGEVFEEGEEAMEGEDASSSKVREEGEHAKEGKDASSSVVLQEQFDGDTIVSRLRLIGDASTEKEERLNARSFPWFLPGNNDSDLIESLTLATETIGATLTL